QLPGYQTRKEARRTNQSDDDLAPGAVEARGLVIQHVGRNPISDFAHKQPIDRRIDEIGIRGLVRLEKILPFRTAEDRKRQTFPKTVAQRAGVHEIPAARVGMKKEIISKPVGVAPGKATF